MQSIVAGSRKCRVVGSAHSFSLIADTEGDHISLEALNVGPPLLDEATGVVWVPGYMSFGALVAFLEGSAWALHNMASLPHITVAGTIATGTHGSGVGNGNLASCVCGLELVLADGSLLRASPSSHPTEFEGMVVHLGSLGVVTRVALQLVPAFFMRQVVYLDLPLETALANFDSIMSAGYSVSLFTTWKALSFEQVWRKAVCSPGQQGVGGAEDAVEEGLAGHFPPVWHGARRAEAEQHPIPGVCAAPCTPQLGVPGPAHHRLPHFRLEFTPSAGEELQSEFFVRREYAPSSLRALSALAGDIAPLLHISEVRAIASDALWLSPHQGGGELGWCAIHFTWKKHWEGVRALLPRIEGALSQFGARPHWGKLFTSIKGQHAMARLYPRLGDFLSLRERLDPTGKFLNPWFAQTLLQ